jgi:hypothetical protein
MSTVAWARRNRLKSMIGCHAAAWVFRVVAFSSAASEKRITSAHRAPSATSNSPNPPKSLAQVRTKADATSYVYPLPDGRFKGSTWAVSGLLVGTIPASPSSTRDGRASVVVRMDGPPSPRLDFDILSHTLDGMYRKQKTDRGPDCSFREVPAPQQVVVLVGDVARDQQRIDELLAANVIVIMIPSLETATSVLSRGETRTQVGSPSTASVGILRVDLTEHRVLFGGLELPVSQHELAILALLSEEPGRARTFAELAEAEGGK